MATGEDLRKYLILPCPHLSSSSSFSTSPDQNQNLQYSSPSNLRSIVSGKRSAKMEIETAPANIGGVGGAGGALDRVFSIDNYVATHAEDVSKENAAIAASKLPMPKKRKASPTNNNNATLPPLPVAVGARSSKHMVLLHQKYQALGTERPEFVFSGDSMRGWSVKMSFLGSDLECEGPFTSKQEGKEAMSEMALGVLSEREKEGGLNKPPRPGFVREMEKQERKKNERREAGINWVGQLLEFQRANAAPEPTYTDYQLDTSFTCLLTIDGYPSPFGSQTALFSSKKVARQHAAECAVKHFKELGILPEGIDPVGGIKKKKAVLMDSHQSIVAEGPRSPGNKSGGVAAGVSFAQQAAHLSTLLSLGTPEWRFSPKNPAAPGFHTVACYFKHSGPHQGPIGEVRHVHGKKKAKEECARHTVEYLTGVRERRLSYGRNNMMRVEGGEGVAGVAVSGGFEGEGGDGGEKEKGEEEEEDSDVEFEDAVEEFKPYT